MVEVWKDSEIMKGYQVSSYGQVRNSKNKKIRKLQNHKAGYLIVSKIENR